MKHWTEQSIEFARQRNYLDELFKVYPLSPNLRRELTHEQEKALRLTYASRNNIELINVLLDAELFPIMETNRQMGALFKNWIARGVIGVPVIGDADEFLCRDDNCVLNASDNIMKRFAAAHLGFTRDKGVDFLAKFNGRYIAGEAKFLTDFGGHQNAQFEDALASLHSFTPRSDVIPVAILDGVLYLNNHGKMHTYLTAHPEDNIMSALVLREFLYSL